MEDQNETLERAAWVTRARAAALERFGVAPPPQALEGWLTQKLGPVAEAGALSALRLDEVALLSGCLMQQAEALKAFDAQVLEPAVRELSGRLVVQIERDELLQRGRERLMIPGAASRLLSWSGKSPLAAWVKAVLTRLALDLRGSGREALGQREAEHAVAQLPCEGNPELDALRAQHREGLASALRRALARLPRRERVVLRLHLFQGLSTDQVGRVFHAHPATVRRWIQGARETVLEGVRAELKGGLGLTPSGVESFVRGLDSRMELSLGALDSRLGPTLVKG